MTDEDLSVKDLIRSLWGQDPEAKVMITYEGVTRAITAGSVYRAADGTVLLDGDDNHYKDRYVSGEYKTRPAERA
jgi:hypothetical protein